MARNDVPDDAKEERRKRLDDLQTEYLTATNRRYQGRTVEILVEERQRGRWRGRTPDNRLVFFSSEEDHRGCLVDVMIEWTGPYSLLGSLTRIHSSPQGAAFTPVP